MLVKRLFALCATLLTLACVIYFASARKQSRRTRISIVHLPNQSESQAAAIDTDAHQACPDMVLIRDSNRADYELASSWSKNEKWGVVVNRKDGTPMLFKEVSPDLIETFRQACAVIRSDAEEMADFSAHELPAPNARYSLTSTQDNVLLIDTKTGAIWKLEQVGLYEEFERVSVEGLYHNQPF